MTIKLNAGVQKRDAVISLNKLASAGNSIATLGEWRNYKKISMWKNDVEAEINRLFSNNQDAIAILFEKGGFENPDFPAVCLTSITISDPKESENISRRNRDLIYYQVKKLSDLKEEVADTVDLSIKKTPIKTISLDYDNYILKINNGDKIIPFYAKRGKEGLGAEKRAFKLFAHLWEFKQVLKDGKKMEEGDFATIENLKRSSGCPTDDAIYQQIKRLNEKFKKAGLDIEIDNQKGKYHLVINTI